MSWILLSLIAPLFWAVSNVLDKLVISRYRLRAIVPLTISVVADVVVALAVLFIHGGFANLDVVTILWALAAGATYSGMLFFYFWAVQTEDISRVVPIFYVTPLFIALVAGLVLHEVFGVAQYAGTFMLVAGAFLISTKWPVSWKMHRAFWLMIASAGVLAINQVIVKHLLDTFDFWTVFALVRLGSAVVLLPFALRFAKMILTSIHGRKAIVGYVIASEALTLVGALLITAAASVGAITLVNALASMQSLYLLVFTVILSIWLPKILQEELGRRTLGLKFFAIIMLIAGGFLVSQ